MPHQSSPCFAFLSKAKKNQSSYTKSSYTLKPNPKPQTLNPKPYAVQVARLLALGRVQHAHATELCHRRTRALVLSAWAARVTYQHLKTLRFKKAKEKACGWLYQTAWGCWRRLRDTALSSKRAHALAVSALITFFVFFPFDCYSGPAPFLPDSPAT